MGHPSADREPPVVADIQSWVSLARFTRYLVAADGNEALARDLYHWNTAVGAACFRVISEAEVLVRNAINDRLKSEFIHHEGWMFHPDFLAILGTSDLDSDEPISETKAKRDSAAKAKAKLRVSLKKSRQVIVDRNKILDADRMVAQLSFQFWGTLHHVTFKHDLWLPYLQYSHSRLATGKRPSVEKVHGILISMNATRNRIAHHESLLDTDLNQLIADADFLFRSLTRGAFFRAPSTEFAREAISARPVRGAVTQLGWREKVLRRAMFRHLRV